MSHTTRYVVPLAVLLVSGANAADLSDAIDADYPYLEALYREFHAHPELSMQENWTSDRLAQELAGLGFEMTRGIGNTGLVGKMVNGEGPVLMIRADMDALPVEEKTGLPYASTRRQVNLEGVEMPVMHACGHDHHMTVLVGTARRMAAMKERWQGTLLLLGQPAEEAIGGARAMVEDGLYERVGRPDFALALHAEAKYPAGQVVVSDSLVYSSADTINLVVRGVGGHGAYPHTAKDPIVLASQIVLALQTIVTRDISPLEPALITVGAFNAGTAPNIIPDQARLQITVRANTEKTRYQLLDAIERVALNTARAAGIAEDNLPIVEVLGDGAPTTTNDTALARRVRAAIEAGMGREAMTEFYQSDMGAEDFPWLVNVDPPIPSVYFIVGSSPAELVADGSFPDHHSPLFRIEEEASITAGVEAMTLAALDLLQP